MVNCLEKRFANVTRAHADQRSSAIGIDPFGGGTKVDRHWMQTMAPCFRERIGIGFGPHAQKKCGRCSGLCYQVTKLLGAIQSRDVDIGELCKSGIAIGVADDDES